MKDKTEARLLQNGALARRRQPAGIKQLWRRIRGPLADSAIVKHGLAWLAYCYLRLVRAFNRPAAGSHDVDAGFRRNDRAIYVLWHGQHLLGPALVPRWLSMAVMFSRSADAEINAIMAEKFGMEAIRGSGGDPKRRSAAKGGARALIAMKNRLAAGKSVVMIADIRSAPRQATLGSLTLARISGRPIVPFAIATSRRKVLARTWDRTTINLPFGRICVVFGSPLHVPPSADDARMEELRAELTGLLDEATTEAYEKVDRKR
jgi:lysophospholipid acyltransferase (LPLAT)-like uncharacterized protein